MRIIYKYPLAVTDVQWLRLPMFARFLCVQDQRGTLTLWAEVDPVEEPTNYKFHVIGTGNPMPPVGPPMQHLGSVQQPPFMWHVYCQHYAISRVDWPNLPGER